MSNKNKKDLCNIKVFSNLHNNKKCELKEQIFEKWLIENKEAINSYNKRVKENGLFSDNLRSF